VKRAIEHLNIQQKIQHLALTQTKDSLISLLHKSTGGENKGEPVK